MSSMPCTKPCCAVCWAVTAGFCLVVLLVMGGMLAQRSPLVEIAESKMENGAIAAFICAGVYGAVLLVSVIYLSVYSRRQKRGGRGFSAASTGRDDGGAETAGSEGGLGFQMRTISTHGVGSHDVEEVGRVGDLADRELFIDSTAISALGRKETT